MPGRQLPLVTNEIYHVFNRGIDHRPVFTTQGEFQRAITTLKFYQLASPPMKLSFFLTLSRDQRADLLKKIEQNEQLIEFLSFCLMPNHFHFLLRQKKDRGISKFMSQFQNSYTRFHNSKHKRVGPLFLDQFKAVRIETDNQLLHVSRYIHLNPHTSFVVKKIEDLINYHWSSFPDYLGLINQNISNREIVLSFFKDGKDYQRFVFDQANYQRELDKIKHLIFEPQ